MHLKSALELIKELHWIKRWSRATLSDVTDAGYTGTE